MTKRDAVAFLKIFYILLKEASIEIPKISGKPPKRWEKWTKGLISWGPHINDPSICVD